MTQEDLKKTYQKMLIDANTSERQLAKKLDVSSQSINQKINRGSIRFLEFSDIINELGFEIDFKKRETK